MDQGERVLFEGAQGTLLDIDMGTYPYVTSSNTVSSAAGVGSGVGPGRLGHILGICKAYTTRVGSGPFPTELNDEVADNLRKMGQEFGATTGRPRRVGWLDLVALKYAVRINGVTSLGLTKLDVLNGFKELKVCTAYRIADQYVTDFPPMLGNLDEAVPVYRSLPGFNINPKQISLWSDLEQNLKDYIRYIENFVGVPVSMIGYGKERSETLIRSLLW